LTETGKKTLTERVHSCSNCGYTTDRDVAAAQVVAIRGLAAVGRAPRRVNYRLTKLNSVLKMLSEGKFIGIPTT
ncbi:MAG: hypothetical protein F6K58_31345, partial [Symploca sp. SIO2E9]|nr:hypothetical protein [Symploca sp. SIO2E9]